MTDERVGDGQSAEGTPNDAPTTPEAPIVVAAEPTNGALSRVQPEGGRSYRDPSGAYLATLRTAKSRSTAVEGMRRIARILGAAAEDTEAWRWIPWTTLQWAEQNMIRAACGARFKPATANMTIAVLRGVLKQAWLLELIPAEQYQRAKALTLIPHDRTVKAGREVTDEDWLRLCEHVATLPEFYGTMIHAMFAVLAYVGVRREEIAKMPLKGVQPGELRFVRKGKKEATLSMPKVAEHCIGRWLKLRSRFAIKSHTLFVRAYPNGRFMDAPMTAYQVWEIVRREADAAGIPKITPHDFRRTYAARALRKEDAFMVQRMLGHADPRTTVGYDVRTHDEMVNAQKRIKPIGSGVRAVAYMIDSSNPAHVEAQRDAIRAWSREYGVTIVGWHREASTGTRLAERPLLRAAIDELREREGTVLVVASRESIATMTTEVDDLLADFGARLIAARSVTMPDGSKLAVHRRVLPFNDVTLAIDLRQFVSGDEETLGVIASAVARDGVKLQVASVPHCMPDGWQMTVQESIEEFDASTDDEKLIVLASVFAESLERKVKVECGSVTADRLMQVVRDGEELLVLPSQVGGVLTGAVEKVKHETEGVKLAFLFRSATT